MARNLTDQSAFDGETLAGTFEAPDNATAVIVKLSDGSKLETFTATKGTDGVWTASITTSGFCGQTRWNAIATAPDGTTVVANGSIYIKPLVSKFRAYVSACETALQNYGNNPNKTISVGDISITYKDRDDLLAIIAYWRGRAEADENGTAASSGPRIMHGGF